MIRAHKIRLNPTTDQADYFARAAGTSRFVFNWGLEQWKRQYEAGARPSALALKKQFNTLRAHEYPWTYEVTKCVVEGAFMDLGKAFRHFFDGLKKGRRVGYLQFKSKKRSKASFYLANDKFTVGDHWITIPKLGRVNMAEKLRLGGKILGARVTKTASWWFVSIQVEVPDKSITNTKPTVGIDVGINRLATLSDGRRFENQKPLRTSLKKLAHACRALSRKQKGSRNREKAREKVARLYYRINTIRDDILHKLTTEVARTCGVVGWVQQQTVFGTGSDATQNRLWRGGKTLALRWTSMPQGSRNNELRVKCLHFTMNIGAETEGSTGEPNASII